MHEATTHLSRLVEQAAEGEDIVIAKAGTPVARLVAYRADESDRVPGSMRGQIVIHDDFDELPPDVAAAFRGEGPT